MAAGVLARRGGQEPWWCRPEAGSTCRRPGLFVPLDGGCTCSPPLKMPKFMASLAQILSLGFVVGNRIPASLRCASHPPPAESSAWDYRITPSTSCGSGSWLDLSMITENSLTTASARGGEQQRSFLSLSLRLETYTRL